MSLSVAVQEPCTRPGARFIRFGPFQVDLQKDLVTKSGSRIRLTGKRYRVLVMLLEKAGEIVSRDAICRDLWPVDAFVNRNTALTTIINHLRKVLEEPPFHRQHIETIRRRGYVFIAPVEVSHDSSRSLRTTGNSSGSPWHLLAAEPLAGGKPRGFSIRRVASLILIGIVLGAMSVWISAHLKGRLATNAESTVRGAKTN